MKGPRQPKTCEGTYCDSCGRWFAWCEFVETIEEHLCEECASGIYEDEPDDDGMEYGYDED